MFAILEIDPVMSYTQDMLDRHLSQEHQANPFADYLREIVYGGNDGIVTTFAVIAGFTGAYSAHTGTYSIITVLLFGLANLFADGAAMGLGNFLSIRAQKDVYQFHKSKERREIQRHPNVEYEQTVFLLKQKGFTHDQAITITDIFSQNEDYWVQFMMDHELELPNPENEKPLINGLVTFASFVVFGFIPIIPYLLMNQPNIAFGYSAMFGVLALISLGLLSGYVSKRNLVVSAIETVAVGGTAGSIAYLVGTFFR